MKTRLAAFSLLAAATLFAWTRLDLKNGGFEDGMNFWTADNSMCSIVTDAAHTGQKFLRIQDEEPLLSCEIRSERIPVTPGKTYAIRFWTRSKVNRTGAKIMVDFLSNAQRKLPETKGDENFAYRMAGSRQWQENIFIVPAPQKAQYAELKICTAGNYYGRIELDDIEMLELTKEEAQKMKSTKQSQPEKREYPELVPERIQELEAMLPEKPTGLGVPCSDRQAWDKLAKSAEGRKLIKAAASLLDEPFPELPDELYLQFLRTGNRTNYQVAYNDRTSRIMKLALAECLENKGRFMPKLEECIDQFLSQKSWVLPAHDSKLTNFNNEELYPDLTGSAVTAMIAYVDWFLQDKLRPETRRRIRHEAFRRSFTPYQNAVRSGKITNGLWWMVSIYNWNAVCTCNLVSAAMILMESRHDRAEMLAAMETSCNFFYKGFTPDGYCSEGLGYWSYGFGHFLTMGEIVLASTNGKLNIFDDDPVIIKCCEYARNIMIEDGIAPAYADCAFNVLPSQINLAIIQRHYPEALLKPVSEPKMPLPLSHFAIFAFTKGKARHIKKAQMPPVSFFDTAGILICRSIDENGNTFGASIKGGHNDESHNHNDVGSYVIVANKVPFICDPGSEVYSRRTFSPQRYVSKVINSYGHDVPVVAGKLQRKGREAKGVIRETSFTPERTSILIDMTSCYKVPDLASLTRRFIFDRVARKITVTDNVEFKSPQTFEDAIITNSSHRIDSDSNVEFYDEKSIVQAKISVTGAGWTLVKDFIENPDRISPTRIGIKLDKPVTKASVECVYEFKPAPQQK